MSEQFSRTEALIGEQGLQILRNSKVAVFGIGGVGGYVVEALARSGVGHLVLIDHDKVSPSNLNRQIIATWQTVGRYKTEVMRERILSIVPETEVVLHNCFYLPETAAEFDFGTYSYVVDAVDTVTAKIDIILRSKEAGVPVISSMGAGNKMDPAQFRVADIYQTSVCPLAKVMRRELKKRGVSELKVVYSTEPPIAPQNLNGEAEAGSEKAEDAGREIDGKRVEDSKKEISLGRSDYPEQEAGSEARHIPARKRTPGSIAFAPSIAGLMIAGEVIRDLIEWEHKI